MSRFSKLETGGSPAPPGSPTAPETTEPAPDLGTELPTWEGCYLEAEQAFFSGETQKALQLYSRAMAMDSTRLEPWTMQALCLVLLDQLREAATWSTRLAESYPEHPLALSVRALVFAHQGMAKRALSTSDYAMSRPDPDPQCWLMRGWILLASENANWEFCFNKTNELCPESDWKPRVLMGMALERHKRWTRALEYYQAALAHHTGNFHLWTRSARCLEKLGLGRKAVEAWQNALDLNPRCREAKAALERLNDGPGLLLLLRRLTRFLPRRRGQA